MFKMSNLDDWILLMGSSIDENKEYADDKIKEIIDTLDYINDALIENINHIHHQYKISSQYNDVEYDGISKITKSTSETKPSKYDPSNFRNPTSDKGVPFTPTHEPTL